MKTARLVSSVFLRVDEFFEVSARGSSLWKEGLGGVSVFLAMSYIIIVNPAILQEAGADRTSVFWATIIVSSLCSFAMGMWANLPFVVAPGMEMNSYVALAVMSGLGLSWSGALGLVFWSGVATVAITLSGLRERLIDSIPPPMKVSISACVGLLIAIIGLRLCGILPLPNSASDLVANLSSTKALVAYGGFATVALLDRAGVTLAPLISIIVAWALSAALGMDQEASSTAARAFPTLPKVQFDVILNVNNLGMFITLFVLDFYGSVAKFVGLLLHTNILKDGRVPNRTRALLIDGAGTAAGAVLGTTSVIAYVESAVAIKMGARTGLASVTCALLLGLGGLLGSDVARIPLISTSGTIVFVGLKLLPDRGSRTNMLVVDYIAMIAMSLTMIATLALERALLVGFMTYVCWEWVHGRTGNIFMAVSAVVLALSYFLR
jgi:AGZA family xanthine/uracil permease-like MFS transporter